MTTLIPLSTSTSTASWTSFPRLDAQASQRTFRLLLEAFSRPGRLVNLAAVAAECVVEPVLLPALALVDLDVTVFVVDAPDRAGAVSRLIERATGATSAAHLGLADMVVASGPIDAGRIAELRTGDAWQPEAGARLSLSCDRLADDDDAEVVVRLCGPGAGSGRSFGVDGIDPAVFEALRVLNAAHPAGVDSWLVDSSGWCVGIPRSSRIEIGAP